ncbi:MAG: phage antirepressor KilAC domain-containing protein [Holosporaceae bacterium]|jgi:anti-repressor protein|nr:phage antirepressor KilAC domain-containing protein [Holosporaceae bacterium]
MPSINIASELQTFLYNAREVRAIQKNDEIWFVAKDICNVFGEANRNRAMQVLDEDEKGYTQMTPPRGMQQCAIVNESGLYSLLFVMRPAKARGINKKYIAEREEKLRQFKRWVTHEVLPQIRKHGAYITAYKIEDIMNNPDAWISLITAIKEERSAKEQLQIHCRDLRLQIEINKPKILFADAVLASDGNILIGELAKILKSNGIEIGQNRLFKLLRQCGFLIKRNGSDYNMPTQKAMELGLFKVKEMAIIHSDGCITISKITKVTGKGQVYFINYFLNENEDKNVAS